MGDTGEVHGEQTTALTRCQADYEAIQRRVRDLQVVDAETKAIGAESVAILKKAIKAADEERKRLVDGLNHQVKVINAPYMAFKEAAQGLLDTLTRKVLAFTQQQQEEARKAAEEEQKRLAAEQKAHDKSVREAKRNGEAPPPPPPLSIVAEQPVSTRTATTMGSVSAGENWTWELADMFLLCRAIAEGQAPTDLVLPNGPSLNKYAKATKGPSPFPGVRFYDKGKLALR